ncbi:class E sortase [Streptomyces sp. NPDC088785]|uniref:class E sortase n=1 Tax=Streptomyces sp. NPDC088785 TaxID=3365897 RepID=UPI00380B8D68
MTALRPERDGGGGDSGELADAVGRLDDPLSDPLPGQHPSPWFRSTPEEPQAEPQRPEPEPEWYDPAGYATDWYSGAQGPSGATPASTPPPASRTPSPAPAPRAPAPAPAAPAPTAGPAAPTPEPPYLRSARDDETVALRTADTRAAAEPRAAAAEPPAAAGPERPAATGGRAERRRAAKRGGGRRRAGAAPAEEGTTADDAPPLSRVEARRAAKAAKPGAGVIASRAIGEVFITLGVLMLLFVTYQLWWSNIRAHNLAGSARDHLEDDWASGKRKPGSFEPGQGFAILYIPKLDVVVPIAEGISKTKVLDKGMVGHYGKDSIPTAMPDAKTGNFSLAGHRNTHGEPFRYINRLQPGDPIVVETQDKYYVYKMSSRLDQTSPSNTSVIAPVPAGSGFTKAGRYITLTTCTPEFTSTYRMIVWGKMVEERPRSKGKPDALVE